MSKTLHVYSGGLDSTVLLGKLLKEGCEVECVNFSYGSKHNEQERKSAIKICAKLGITLQIIDLGFIGRHFKSDLLNTGGEVPEGHYAKPSMKRTVVPFRNSILGSIAVGIAESLGFEGITLAVHTGDHFIYPDCTPQFFHHFRESVFHGTDSQVKVIVPFIIKNKTDIVKIGNTLQLNDIMGMSYTCYNGRKFHCGKCGSCTERKEAFKDSGVQDLTIYEEK